MRNKKVTQLVAGLLVTAMVGTGIVIPSTTAQAKAKSVTIKTQKQLDAALKDPKVTSIMIKTSKGVALKIKTGDYGKKNLIINAPKATVNNYGNFKKISIQDGKTVYDRGLANNIAVSDKNSLKLYAGKQSKDTDITITSKGSKITIVNNGNVDSINVKGKSTVTVSGSAKEAPTITNNASGSKIVTTMDAAVVLNKSASLTVKSGATLDSLTMKADATVTVSAGTTVNELIIDKADANVNLKINGTVGKVIVDQKATINVSGTTTDTVTVENNASGSEINSAVKTDVSLNADAKISLEKGAEGSTVKSENADVKPTVENKTDEKVTVTDSTGKDSTIDAGKTEADAKPSTGDTNQGNTDSGNTSSGSTGGDPYYPPSGNGGTVVEKPYMNVSVTKLATAPDDANKVASQKNQDAITVTEVKAAGTLAVKVSGNLSEMATFTSTNPNQTGNSYWIGLVVNTGESDITKVKIGDYALTEDDVAEANTINLAAGSFILWLRAEKVRDESRTLVLSTDGKKNVMVTISFEDPMATDELKEVVTKAQSYEGYNDELIDWLKCTKLTANADQTVVTADFSGNNASDTNAGIAEIYAACADNRNGKQIVNGLVDGKDAVQYAIDAFVRNTFARYIGAIHRAEADTYTVETVKFDGKVYTWNITGGELKGSNWRDENNKTLVSAVAETLSVNKCVELQLLDENANAVSLTFKAENVPTKADLDATLNAELYNAVVSAGTYDYDADPNYMGREGITVNGAIVTADFSEDAEANTKILKAYNGLKGDDVDKDENEKQQLSVNTYVLYTFARYAGALHRYNNAECPVSKIVFKNKEYTWNGSEALKGSNWKCSEGTSLVKDVKYACMMDTDGTTSLTTIKDIVLDLVGKDGKKITVTFKVTNVPSFPTSA